MQHEGWNMFTNMHNLKVLQTPISLDSKAFIFVLLLFLLNGATEIRLFTYENPYEPGILYHTKKVVTYKFISYILI